MTAVVDGMEELARTRLAALFVRPTDGHDDVSSELLARLTGLDRSSPATRLSVTSAVDWGAMRWAKAEGFREFDLRPGGLLTPPGRSAAGRHWRATGRP